MTPSPHPDRNRFLSLLAIPAIVVLDLCVKAWAQAMLVEGEPVPIAPFFDLTLSFNSGVAFGLFNSSGLALVVITTALITVVFGMWWWREPNTAAQFGLALILGGAVGNLADRLSRGAVTDFLDFHVAGLHWPAFNLADSSLTVGVLVLLIAGMRNAPTPKKRDGHANELG